MNGHKYMEKYLKSIIGGKVVGLVVDEDTFHEPCYGLKVQKTKTSKPMIAWVMCDEEGNGPGFLVVEPFVSG